MYYILKQRDKYELANAILKEKNEEELIDKICNRKIVSYEELGNLVYENRFFIRRQYQLINNFSRD